MIVIDTVEEMQDFLHIEKPHLTPEDYKRACVDVARFINEQTNNAVILNSLGILPDDIYNVIKSFVCDLMDVILQAWGVDATKLLDEVAGNEGKSMAEVIFGDMEVSK